MITIFEATLGTRGRHIMGHVRYIVALLGGMLALGAHAQIGPVTTCDSAGIGATTLIADAPVTILIGRPGDHAATRVDALLPGEGAGAAGNQHLGWPARWAARGTGVGSRWAAGVYAGTASLTVPTSALLGGYAGATTDTGHAGGPPRFPPFLSFLDGSFGCVNNCVGNSAANPGQPNVPLQVDFAYRSEHLMAVIGKQLVQGVLWSASRPIRIGTAARPAAGRACGWRRTIPATTTAFSPVRPRSTGTASRRRRPGTGSFSSSTTTGRSAAARNLVAKESLATSKAVAACDALDGVVDGVLTDPRACNYSARADSTITKASCTPSDTTCLTPTEALAIDHMWKGPGELLQAATLVQAAGWTTTPRETCTARVTSGLWYPNERGTDLSALGGATSVHRHHGAGEVLGLLRSQLGSGRAGLTTTTCNFSRTTFSASAPSWPPTTPTCRPSGTAAARSSCGTASPIS